MLAIRLPPTDVASTAAAAAGEGTKPDAMAMNIHPQTPTEAPLATARSNRPRNLARRSSCPPPLCPRVIFMAACSLAYIDIPASSRCRGVNTDHGDPAIAFDA
jgi:hypothetical protein